jgi:hypothetical protein
MHLKENFTFYTSSDSLITKIYTSANNALSFFTKKPSELASEELFDADKIFSIKDPEKKKKIIEAGLAYLASPHNILSSSLNRAIPECFPAEGFFSSYGARGVQESDPIHSSCHQTLEDKEIFHHHILKNNDEMLTLGEVTCILNVIGKSLDKNGINEEDYNKLLADYTKYYEQEKSRIGAETKSKEPLPPSPDKVKNFFNIAFSSFAYSFITTLLRKYIGPYLINQGQAQTVKTIEPVCSSVMWLLTSLPVAITDTVLRYVIDIVLTKMNVEKNTRYNILHNLSSAMTMVPYASNILNPMFYVELGVNQGGAKLGEKSAYAIIHRLPKLKTEPTISNNVQDAQQNNSSLDTLTRRR